MRLIGLSQHPRRPRRLRHLSTLAALAALATVAAGTVPAGADDGRADGATAAKPRGQAPAGLGATLAANQAARGGPATVFVRLATSSAVDAYAAGTARGASEASAQRAAQDARRAVARQAESVADALRAADRSTKVLATTSNAVPGLIAETGPEGLRALAARADVAAVSPVVAQAKASTNSVQLTGALNTWRSTGRTGAGIRVGIVDDGIDYTHAAFGGVGTKEAYRAIKPDVADPGFPTRKVVGGTDFVGDNYDASGRLGSPTPVPDPNPISCGHHGTHGASIIASQGVNADGTTFTGDYAKLTPETVAAMKVGPGMAPQASLYSLKVFGCNGLTSTLTAKALDHALDPNGDGDFADKLDIVSLALSSNYNSVDDPLSLFVRKLAQHDVLSVFSAGNGGDLYDVAGSPGSLAPEALTVGSTRDSYVLRDGARIEEPAALRGTRSGQYSLAHTGLDELDLTRPVVALAPDNAQGCKPYAPGDATAVAGKIVWIEMHIQRTIEGLECGSAARANNAQRAGAAAVVLSAEQDHFTSRLTGTASMPMFQFTATSTAALRPALEAGTLTLRLVGTDRARVPSYDHALTDTASVFTSRGIRGPVVKPDLSAPGDTIAAAFSGSGTDRAVYSGTSMSAPHATGIMALIRQAQPGWSYEEAKAAAMNTAGHDIVSDDGKPLTPQRVGAGRIDARAALDTNALAYVADDPGAVSASFGVVEADRRLVRAKTVKVVNKSARPQLFRAAYQPIAEMPGVRFSVSPPVVYVPPRGTAKVTVTLRIDDIRALRKAIEPAMEAVQGGLARQFVADASGRLVLTPRLGATRELRVPVAASPKPVSTLRAPASLTFRDGQDSAALTLRGRGLDQGTGSAAYRSLAGVFELGARSPRLPDCADTTQGRCALNATARGGDLRWVGATSTAPTARAQGAPERALAAFSVVTWGNWANIGSNTVPAVRIDTTGDGTADYESYVVKAPRSDVLLVNTVDLRRPLPAGGFASVDTQPVNGHFGEVDTNTFDTNVLVLPVRLSALGIDPSAASHPIRYTVSVGGFYRAPGHATVDQTDAPVTFDPLAPRYWARAENGPAGTVVHPVRSGRALAVHRSPGAADGELLALFHHNADGERAAVIDVRGRSRG
ncbi:S8 family serine peptidase [Streptomyces sp. NPDC057638]|uniref:S8 family serine peptidase n=1 Tax=Streptomyces sp. NPDC057638 TaxID=3346190 RepID=UPI00368F5DAE